MPQHYIEDIPPPFDSLAVTFPSVQAWTLLAIEDTPIHTPIDARAFGSYHRSGWGCPLGWLRSFGVSKSISGNSSNWATCLPREYSEVTRLLPMERWNVKTLIWRANLAIDTPRYVLPADRKVS